MILKIICVISKLIMILFELIHDKRKMKVIWVNVHNHFRIL